MQFCVTEVVASPEVECIDTERFSDSTTAVIYGYKLSLRRRFSVSRLFTLIILCTLKTFEILGRLGGQ